MAQRRMFSKKVTDTDAFLDMPLSTQALYFHLNMHADDDGFVGNINTIKRMIGSSTDDQKLLIAKSFIIPFEESGVVVIKDWRMHNYIRKDTYNKTVYQEERLKLGISDTGSYFVDEPSTERIQDVDTGKVRIGKSKDRLEVGKQDPTADLRIQISQFVSDHGFANNLTPIQLTQILEYVTEDGMDIDVIGLAMQEASNRGIRNFKYLDAILSSKLREGVKSAADWQATKQQHQASTDKSIPEWMQKLQEEADGE